MIPASLTTLLTHQLIPLFGAACGFGLLITVHEFGHFLFAQLFNINTPIFSIGFGPTLIKKQIGATEFRLSLIPLGGYCAIEGAEEAEANMPQSGSSVKKHKNGSFEDRPYWQKLLVMIGGIAFNLIFAFFIFTYLTLGTVQNKTAHARVSSVVKASIAEKAGIKEGDIITGYNGKTITTDPDKLTPEFRAFLQTIAASRNKTLSINIDRNGTHECIKPDFSDLGDKPAILGVSFALAQTPIPGSFTHYSFTEALVRGYQVTARWVKQTASGIYTMFTHRSLRGVGGPVAILSQTFKSAQTGFEDFLHFLALISIGLALLNLLPFGALDGGQLFFVTFEAIIRRKLPENLKLGIIITSYALFLLLVIYLSYHDLMRLFGF